MRVVVGLVGLVGLGIALIVAAVVIELHTTLTEAGQEECMAMTTTRRACPGPTLVHHTGLALTVGGTGLGLLGVGLVVYLVQVRLRRHRS